MEYTIVTDDDCHRFIIPFDKLKEWNDFLDIPEEECDGSFPEWANRIDGETVVFKEYRLDG